MHYLVITYNEKESEKEYIYMKVKVLVCQSCLTLCNSMDWSLPGSSVHEIFPGKNIGVGRHSLLQGNLPDPGVKPRSPAMQADSLLSKAPVLNITFFILNFYLKCCKSAILQEDKKFFFFKR